MTRKEAAEKKAVCKKIISDAKDALDRDFENTKQLVRANRSILTKKATYVSDYDLGSSFASSY